jgi:hypothetical protein
VPEAKAHSGIPALTRVVGRPKYLNVFEVSCDNALDGGRLDYISKNDTECGQVALFYPV